MQQLILLIPTLGNLLKILLLLVLVGIKKVMKVDHQEIIIKVEVEEMMHKLLHF